MAVRWNSGGSLGETLGGYLRSNLRSNLRGYGSMAFEKHVKNRYEVDLKIVRR